MKKDSTKNKTELYLIIFFLLVIGFFFYISLTNPLIRAIRKGQNISGLVVGCDEVDYARHADTIIFLNYQPKEHFLNLLFIPRDTKVDTEDLRVKRINEIYAYFYRRENNINRACQNFTKVIETFLSNGDREVRIPYYLELNYRGFVKMVNLLGGIPIKIDKVMDYHDTWGNLHIHFEPGEYLLNGEKALEYVRYRDESGDPERIIRQQRFLRNLVHRIRNPLLIFKLPFLIKESITTLHTNLSFWDILAVSLEMKNLSMRNIRILSLPGKPEQTLWIPESEKIKSLLDLFFETKLPTSVSPLTVEIWNATATQGLALKVTKLLRRQGIDVIKWGNYGEKKESTLLIDRCGDMDKVQKIAKILTCRDIITHIEPARLVDVTVILGEDYLKTFQGSPSHSFSEGRE